MDWRIRIPGGLYRRAVEKAGTDQALADQVRAWLERYTTGTADPVRPGPRVPSSPETHRRSLQRDTPAARISRQASRIAGAAWDDRQRVGTLAGQLRAVAATSGAGSDGDLTDEDRALLRALADEAETESGHD